jgi:hypothetical protein
MNQSHIIDHSSYFSNRRKGVLDKLNPSVTRMKLIHIVPKEIGDFLQRILISKWEYISAYFYGSKFGMYLYFFQHWNNEIIRILSIRIISVKQYYERIIHLEITENRFDKLNLYHLRDTEFFKNIIEYLNLYSILSKEYKIIEFSKIINNDLRANHKTLYYSVNIGDEEYSLKFIGNLYFYKKEMFFYPLMSDGMLHNQPHINTYSAWSEIIKEKEDIERNHIITTFSPNFFNKE